MTRRTPSTAAQDLTEGLDASMVLGPPTRMGPAKPPAATLLAQINSMRHQLDGLEACVKAFAASATNADEDFVDRRSCAVSGRLWDRAVKTGELPVFRDGRRFVARRSDVRALIERARVFRIPKSREELDPDLAALDPTGACFRGAGQ